MAGRLVESLHEDFHPERYKDEYRKAVLDVIKHKAAGKEIEPPPEEDDEDADGPDGRARGEPRRGRALMARPLWSGSLSFGLVNVPVQLFSGVRDRYLHFRQLHEKDGSPIETRRFCSEEDKEVPFEAVGRAYERDRAST